MTSLAEARRALDELRHLTACRCLPDWTDRGRHETHCVWQYREDVNTLALYLAKQETP